MLDQGFSAHRRGMCVDADAVQPGYRGGRSELPLHLEGILGALSFQMGQQPVRPGYIYVPFLIS